MGNAPLSERRRGRAFGATAFLAFLGVAGAISTALWVGSIQLRHPLSLLSGAVIASLLLCAALTLLNLMARWFRWHFLIRRFTRKIATRDSLVVYMTTLPAIITPFFLGELVRALILRRKMRPPHRAKLIWVWLIERILDAAVLLWLLLLTVHGTLGLASLPVLGGVTFLLFRMLLEDHRASTVLAIGSICLFVTAAAWMLPVVALVGTLNLCSRDGVAFAVGMKAFSAGTLFGAATGLPLGVSVTGSTMIGELLSNGVATAVAIPSVLVYRTGTAWFAVILGATAFLFLRQRLKVIMRDGGTGHFDDIADHYADEIPKHIRQRLLARKVCLIQEQLRREGIPDGARGLDLGCGQGWYMSELALGGYRMTGVDYSRRQLATATGGDSLGGGELRGHFVQADAESLPFAEGAFDFAYSINAFHHLASPTAQLSALREVIRVLRPRGAFVLHEINTQNPIFRLYMGYLFPLLRVIDEGTEQWMLPQSMPDVPGALWRTDVQYFTFTSDFVPSALQSSFDRLERSLERSRLRRYSAHYQVALVKSEKGSG